MNYSFALGLGILFIALSGVAELPTGPQETPRADIEVFAREGCPHCEAAKLFLEKLQKDHPELQILFHDVGEDSPSLTRLRTLAATLGVEPLGVKTFYLRGELIVGFNSDETTGKQLEQLLVSPLHPAQTRDSDGPCTIQSPTPCDRPKGASPDSPPSIDLPWFGSYSLHDIGLPLFTVLLGLLDGFNPCAMWVLLFLLSLLATLGNRRKMFLIGGTFVVICQTRHLR